MDAIDALLDALPMNPIIDIRPSDRLRSRPLPEWRWPMTKTYNGFSGAERVRGWQMTKWLEDLGVLARASECSICGKTGRVQYHNENYYNIFSAPQVCQGCHRRIHGRFSHPESWGQFVSEYTNESPWFSRLSLEPIDVAGFVVDTHGPAVRELFSSPLYTLPDWLPTPTTDLCPFE